MADAHSVTTNTDASDHAHESILRRSWAAMAEMFSPFSHSALESLPRTQRPARYLRADAIPHTEQNEDGERPLVRDYHAINSLPPQVRVPRKIPTPIRVEGKVWFANERTWVAWMNNAILIGTLALALFNASKDDIAKYFAYFYAAVSIGITIYGYVLYQYRITLIRRRDPGHFDFIAGPIVVTILLFGAVLANFLIRVRELQQKEIPIPGTGLFTFVFKSNTTLFVAQH